MKKIKHYKKLNVSVLTLSTQMLTSSLFLYNIQIQKAANKKEDDANTRV